MTSKILREFMTVYILTKQEEAKENGTFVRGTCKFDDTSHEYHFQANVEREHINLFTWYATTRQADGYFWEYNISWVGANFYHQGEITYKATLCRLSVAGTDMNAIQQGAASDLETQHMHELYDGLIGDIASSHMLDH